MRTETIGNATLYLGDCREVLPGLIVDAVVMDPPYGTKAYKHDDSGATVSSVAWALSACAVVAVFGYPEKLIAWCANHRPISEWVTWAPTNKITRGHKNLPKSHEAIAIWGDLLWLPTEPRATDKFCNAVSERRGLTVSDRLMGDIWTDAAPGMGFNSHQREHPNEKPVLLLDRLVKMITPAHALVADPFMGSGTTGVSCTKLGRHFVGIEIDPKHFAVACRRIEQAQKQMRLFA